MSKQDFCHLHFHSSYSLLDGATRIKEAVKQAAEWGMKGLALTDHGVMHGAIEFYNACRKEGIKPVIGCEMYTTDNMHERKRLEDGSQSNHLLLLAKDEVGYNNLIKLVSAGHIDGFYYKPRIDKELLAQHSEGLIGTTACLASEPNRHILRGDMKRAMDTIGTYSDIFGKDNYYIELQNHNLEEQHKSNSALVDIHKKTGLPLICSNDVHYLKPEHYEAHEVMLCMQTQTVMTDPKRLRYGSDQFYMKSQEEMFKLFSDYPTALTNTVDIVRKCNLELKLESEAPLHFPSYEVPDGHDHKSFLIHLAKEGIARWYDGANIEKPESELEQTLASRFKHELSIIEKTGFINYFLVVWDFVIYAKNQRIPVGPGRGSGAGSLVAYALGITTVDPLRYNLIFERFLNPDRISPPDFDIDFCQARRGEVIQYVKEKYGHENCAQIITFGSLGAKTVIRDLARVLEIPLTEADKFAKMIPEEPGMTLEKAEAMNPEFKTAVQRDPNLKRIMKYARTLEGLPRNQGTHAAGVVIGEKPLDQIIPLCRDKEKQAMAQFEMKPLEMTGLLKMDFLGLKTLTVIQEAVDNVMEFHGVEIDIESLIMDDDKTYELLNRGDTVGVFQVESKGMRDLLRQFQLTRFEDLIAMIALYRPGPMDMIPDFIKRRHKLVDIKYDHPLLETVLNETYGVFIYQEQVQQAANVLAGFTLAQGDLLRRAMGKKVLSIMEEQRGKFVDGARDINQIDPKLAGKIFDDIEKFASYGFNKSHSAAYAVISYRTAYLKAHYKPEFMAALLSAEMGNADKLPGFIAETQEMGMEVLPPNVQQSSLRFSPENENVRFGMAGIKNVGVGAVEAIVAERKANGPFKGFMDFCMRLDSSHVNKKVLEALVMCGAFDWTGLTRARLFNSVEFAMNRSSSVIKDRKAGQFSLFDTLADGEEKEITDDEIPMHEPWSESEMLANEKMLLGFYISGHPLKEFEWEIKTFGQMLISDLGEQEHKSIVRVGGLVTDFRKMFTKKTQEPMCAFRLEGLEAACDAVMFPAAFKIHGYNVQEDLPVMLGGEVSLEEGDPKLFVTEIYPLKDAPKIFGDKVSLHLAVGAVTPEKLEQVKEVCNESPGDVPFVIVLEYPGGQKVFLSTENRYRVNPRHRLLHGLEQIFGEGSVFIQIFTETLKRPPEPRFGNGSFKKAG